MVDKFWLENPYCGKNQVRLYSWIGVEVAVAAIIGNIKIGENQSISTLTTFTTTTIKSNIND